ncbi:hypothetical protein FOA52_010636 [Chlamydomonas sp. UWO 241]|nr:hypothetical protein FOA52_010636 [Chlamydomonas sp. UWO 241]
MFLVLVAILGAECWWRNVHLAHTPGGGGPGLARGKSGPGGGSQPSLLPGAAGAGGGGGALLAGGAAPSHSSNAAATDAALCGLEAGACFGLSAAACRTGFILGAKLSFLCVPLGLGSSVVLTSSGFVLQTRGLKAGNTIIVCTMAAVSSMVSGVLAGLLVLEEKMPSGHGMKLVRLASWACILLGVTGLAGGRKGIGAFTRTLAGWLPPQHSVAWRYVPRAAALQLHKLQKGLLEDDESADDGMETGRGTRDSALKDGSSRSRTPAVGGLPPPGNTPAMVMHAMPTGPGAAAAAAGGPPTFHELLSSGGVQDGHASSHSGHGHAFAAHGRRSSSGTINP